MQRRYLECGRPLTSAHCKEKNIDQDILIVKERGSEHLFCALLGTLFHIDPPLKLNGKYLDAEFVCIRPALLYICNTFLNFEFIVVLAGDFQGIHSWGKHEKVSRN